MAKQILIENEGALFRGFAVSFPQEVWNPGSGWRPYTGHVPKPIEWGGEISEEEADAIMRERMDDWTKRGAGNQRRR